LGFGLLCWLTLLFSPLAFVQTVNAADEADSYGTVIGIVSLASCLELYTASYKPLTCYSGSWYHLQLCRCDAEGQG
jgi:hypothetical protein